MSKTEKLHLIKKKDALTILLMLAAALAAWAIIALGARSKSERHAEIYFDGVLAKTVPLDVPQVFSISELPGVVFEVNGGSIAFISSDCPDKVCVNAGKLDTPGDFAACLPNKATLWISGGKAGSGVDITVK